MNSEEILPLVNAYPVILTAILILLGSAITAIPFAYALGVKEGRRKAQSLELAEAKDCIRIEQHAKEEAQNETSRLEAEIARCNEVAYCRHWGYRPFDHAPRSPLCPKCGKRMEIKEANEGYLDATGRHDIPALQFTCLSCKQSHCVQGDEMNQLENALEFKHKGFS